MNDVELGIQLEGLLFAMGRPLARSELAAMLEVAGEDFERALKIVGEHGDRGVMIVDDGTYVELRVAPRVAPLVERARKDDYSRDIGRAGLEVLSAVLYRGPLGRADIDFIRGVNSSATLRTLTQRGLIRRIPNTKDAAVSAGRRSSYLYEPTTELLSTMGATHVRDLPNYDAVKTKLSVLEHSYKNTLANETSL